MIKALVNYSLGPTLWGIAKLVFNLLGKHFLDTEYRKGVMKEIDRYFTFLYQRIKYGYDESETWDLQTTIIEFVYPRLKTYIDKASEMIDNERHLEECKFICEQIEPVFKEKSVPIDLSPEYKDAVALLGQKLAEGSLWW